MVPRALTILGLLSVVVHAADIPVRYTVNDTTLKAAINGTPLTFELFANSTCTGPAAFSTSIPVQDVSVISRLKVFKAKGGTSAPPKTAEIASTLTGVTTIGNLFLKVTGLGIVAVGEACQAQAASVQSTVLIAAVPPPVVKAANGAIVAVVGGVSNSGEAQFLVPGFTPPPHLGLDRTGIPQGTTNVIFFASSDCSGPALLDQDYQAGVSPAAVYRPATGEVYVAPPAPTGTLSIGSRAEFQCYDVSTATPEPCTPTTCVAPDTLLNGSECCYAYASPILNEVGPSLAVIDLSAYPLPFTMALQ